MDVNGLSASTFIPQVLLVPSMDPEDSSVIAVEGQSLMEVPCPVDQTPQNCNFDTDDCWRLRLIGVCVWGGAISLGANGAKVGTEAVNFRTFYRTLLEWYVCKCYCCHWLPVLPGFSPALAQRCWDRWVRALRAVHGVPTMYDMGVLAKRKGHRSDRLLRIPSG